ncbi:MAG: type II toxin-antitoxin system RelE/ParE family toxin [Edaphocola sp.]
MGLKIFWSQLAEDKLQDIFDYYKFKAGLKTARKIISQIVNRTDILETQPQIGAKEPLLTKRPQDFRYLVSTNYKIIYYINQETKRIVIANVFDTRQNPEKIQETKS